MDRNSLLPGGVKHEGSNLSSEAQVLGEKEYSASQDSSRIGRPQEYLDSSLRCHSYSIEQSPSAGPRGTSQSSMGAGVERQYSSDALTNKAVAFLAGPRERIHVFGNPVEHCPRCQQEGISGTSWRPHRHIGELKIRYICERKFNDLESNHHFDIPLCPLCGQVLYLYDFNGMLGISSARRLHKYVLKCANHHVLPLLDLFCQTKKSGERCNANLKLQWSYGTMVKRCESQKNRDHDLWWVRYKNEWKQRRTIIRYKKDFLSHISDVQRALLLGLGLEGEPPPDPKTTLGPTYDALVSSVAGTTPEPKTKKRGVQRANLSQPSSSPGDDNEQDLSPVPTKRRRNEGGPIHHQIDHPMHHPVHHSMHHSVNHPMHHPMHHPIHHHMHPQHPVHPLLAVGSSSLYSHGLDGQPPPTEDPAEWLMDRNGLALYSPTQSRPPRMQ